jgi:hypothetical protein
MYTNLKRKTFLASSKNTRIQFQNKTIFEKNNANSTTYPCYRVIKETKLYISSQG